MHIAQINFQPAPQGLAAADVLEQWPSLAAIPEAVVSGGMRVSVVQAAARQERARRGAVDYHFIDLRDIDTVSGRALAFAGVLDDIRADVLHVHGLGFAEQAFAVARHVPRVPLMFQDHADRPPRWWRRPAWRSWYACAAGVAFTAATLARPFTRAGLFGPRTQLFAIPESSCRFNLGDRARARAASGLHGDPCVAWVGHLNANKDPLSMLEGVAQAVSRLPGLQLWCAFGSAPLLVQVQERIARDTRLSGRVHLLGPVAHAQVERLLQAADCYVSASHAESCGYALVEAMACGAWPIVTDIPSYRALTGEGRMADLWPCRTPAQLAEALVRAAANRPAPDALRAYFDTHLSLEAVGRQWARAYAQVFDARPSVS